MYSMKTIVAGSREYTDYRRVKEILNCWEITEIVHGNCRGVDKLGERYAKEHNIPFKPFPADWETYGKAAGPIRNREMAEYAKEGRLILIWDGKSKGSADMKKQAEKHDIQVFEYILNLTSFR
jgi:hypothetical protein